MYRILIVLSAIQGFVGITESIRQPQSTTPFNFFSRRPMHYGSQSISTPYSTKSNNSIHLPRTMYVHLIVLDVWRIGVYVKRDTADHIVKMTSIQPSSKQLGLYSN